MRTCAVRCIGTMGQLAHALVGPGRVFGFASVTNKNIIVNATYARIKIERIWEVTLALIPIRNPF